MTGITRIDFKVLTANNRLVGPSDTTGDDPGTDLMRYDKAGNLVWDYHSAEVGKRGAMTYDAENRMLTAVGNTHQYRYDADGKRTRRLVAGSPEMWLVYGVNGELVAEYDALMPGGTLKKEYGYRSGQMLIVYDSMQSGDNRLKWMVTDHLGSTRMLVNWSGGLCGAIERRDYLPFGEELPSTIGHRNAACTGYVGGNNPRQKFTGHERDSESSLDFVQARYYSSIQGRFTSVDPYDPLNSGDDTASRDHYTLQPQNWNRYTYALNNPNKYVDHDGKNPLLTGLFGAIGGAAFGAGLEVAKALYRGESLTDAKVLQRIGAKALNGAIVGGVTGLTGNIAAGKALAAITSASILGGATERILDGNEQTQALDKSDIAIDAVAGLTGGYVGRKVLAYVDDMTYSMRQAAYESYLAIENSQIFTTTVERDILQSALSTFKYTFNSGLNEKARNAAQGITKGGITVGLTQLQILYINYESQKRHRSVDCDNPKNRCRTDVKIIDE